MVMMMREFRASMYVCVCVSMYVCLCKPPLCEGANLAKSPTVALSTARQVLQPVQSTSAVTTTSLSQQGHREPY